ncbi:MAG: outer membrane beta-barrel protein [Bacteroidota bacterium]|nr:outer membrane beta-barrel protein [Bacteroidota bacterium]
MKVFVNIFFLLLPLTFFSQQKKDSVKVDSKKDKKEISEFDLKNYKSDPHDRLILEINHTGFLNLPQGINQSYKSVGFNFDIMFDKPIKNSAFSFGYGIGLLSHNFHSNADVVYKRDSLTNSFLTSMQPFNRPYTLNRFAQKILEIPLELRYRTKTDRQFKIHLGVKFGYVVNNFRSIADNDGKVRVYNIKNVNPFRYGINFRIGWEQLALTANYYLSEVFVKDKGINGINLYSLGIAIIPY